MVSFSADDENTDMQTNAINMQKLMAVFAGGEDLLFIMDQDAYDYICGDEEGIFVDLSEVFPNIDIIEGDKLILNETSLGQKTYMNVLDEDIFLCVRDIGGTVNNDEESNSDLENSLDYVENLLREEYPDQFPAEE